MTVEEAVKKFKLEPVNVYTAKAKAKELNVDEVLYMKIGVIGIIIEGDRKIASSVNSILSEYGDIITGRMGVPNLAENVYVISVAVKATNEQISALTGRLGRLNGVKAKAAVTDASV